MASHVCTADATQIPAYQGKCRPTVFVQVLIRASLSFQYKFERMTFCSTGVDPQFQHSNEKMPSRSSHFEALFCAVLGDTNSNRSSGASPRSSTTSPATARTTPTMKARRHRRTLQRSSNRVHSNLRRRPTSYVSSSSGRWARRR